MRDHHTGSRPTQHTGIIRTQSRCKTPEYSESQTHQSTKRRAGAVLSTNAMYGDNIPHPQGVHVGDIVTAVNGKAVTTPDQFIKVWNEMNKAQVLRVELVRNEEALRIEYPIVE